MHRLTGRRAVITGGAQGIGRGIAAGFAAEGADVAVIDVQPDAAGEELIAEAAAAGWRTHYVRADIGDEREVSQAMSAVARVLGGVDILVNNAGVVGESPIADMPVAEWDRVMAVNLRGAFLCTRAVLPGMLAQGYGRIIKLGQLPMRRFGQVAEVVPTAVFLASDDSSYYTGQTLGPNGGDVML